MEITREMSRHLTRNKNTRFHGITSDSVKLGLFRSISHQSPRDGTDPIPRIWVEQEVGWIIMCVCA